MRTIVALLAVMACWLGLAGPAFAATPKAAADGSLVLEGEKKSHKEKGSQGDTLYDLLGQEVQVYIFNTKTKVFPTAYLKSGYFRSGSASWRTCYNPQVQALINKYANLYGVDPALVQAVIRHESGFNPGAVSPKGAQGLMQLMPGTAALMGVNNPFDPEQNVAGGVGYLRRCLDRFGHNVPLAVAAYNAGPERVAKSGAVPPIPETQVFVNNVMVTYAGPEKMRQAPGPKGKMYPASQDPLQGKGLKKAAAKADQDQEQPRRRRPKIIEVRSLKQKPPETRPD
jgi:soluble lytic murein transglycosylase-like protein